MAQTNRPLASRQARTHLEGFTVPGLDCLDKRSFFDRKSNRPRDCHIELLLLPYCLRPFFSRFLFQGAASQPLQLFSVSRLAEVGLEDPLRFQTTWPRRISILPSLLCWYLSFDKAMTHFTFILQSRLESNVSDEIKIPRHIRCQSLWTDADNVHLVDDRTLWRTHYRV